MRFGIANDLIFEEGVSSSIGEVLTPFHPKNVLFVCGKSLFKSGLGQKMVKSLEEVGICYHIFDQVPQDPTDTSVDETAAAYRDKSIDLILAVGGGSVMDFSKGVAVCLTNHVGIVTLENVPEVQNAPVPLVAVPTTAGTGSEVTSFAIITHTKEIRKMVVAGRYMRAALAVCDPLLLVSLPAKLTAYTGMDALTHAMEAYVSRLSSPLSDLFALKAIELIGQNLKKAFQQPEDLEVRSNLLLGSLIAGYAFDNAVLGLVHAIAHPLGAHFHIQHGAANAIALAEVLQFNSEVVPKKTLRMGVALGLDPKTVTIDQVVEYVKRLTIDLNIPQLSECGVSKDDFSMLAEATLKESCLPLNPRDVTHKDVVAILEKVY